MLLSWRVATVEAVRAERPGLIGLDTVGDDGRQLPAVAYPDVVGRPVPGQRVLLNCTALEQGLGTGGVAFVVAPADGSAPADGHGPAGHLVKARYTPLQVTIASADEQGSAHHDLLADADDLDGLVVVVADLHSALPAVLAGLYEAAPETPVAYVMTDGAALPMAFSTTVAGLTEAGWLAGTVTTGQAYGGQVECVSLHSGLLAARHVLGARVAVVSQGPGNLGTGSRWGFSGVAAGEAVNAASVLSGRPVASLRISAADPRERHRGVSHHSLTAYGRVALSPADVVVPELAGVDAALAARVDAEAAALAERHRLVRVPVDGLAAAVAGSPVPVRSMGRGFDDDPGYFLAAAAAGRHAAGLAG